MKSATALSTTKKEFKTLDLVFSEFKATDEASMAVEGYAAVFGNVDSYRDIVVQGAFTETLNGLKMLPMLWQHDSDEVIGKWTAFTQDNKGLKVQGNLIDTVQGMDCYKLLKAGAVTGLSIGYSTESYEMDITNDIRKLTNLELYEVSLVTFPANTRAQITRVKSKDGKFMTEREFEDFLRDAGGLSAKEIKTVISKGYKAMVKEQRDVVEPPKLKTLTDLFNQFKL